MAHGAIRPSSKSHLQTIVRHSFCPIWRQMRALPLSFFRAEVWTVAQALLGKVLIRRDPLGEVAIRITETEAYAGVGDRACHAYGGRRTPRVEPMYAEGGTLYIYLNYGLHHLLNIVTGPVGDPCAVLIRAGEPLWGHELMAHRRKRSPQDPRLTVGPGNLTKALDIPLNWSGQSVIDHSYLVLIEDDYEVSAISAGPRVGVEYAGMDAQKPWRYWISDSAWVFHRLQKLPNFA